MTPEECLNAADHFARTFGNPEKDESWPRGCYHFKNGKFYLNTADTGGVHADGTPICQEAACPETGCTWTEFGVTTGAPQFGLANDASVKVGACITAAQKATIGSFWDTALQMGGGKCEAPTMTAAVTTAKVDVTTAVPSTTKATVSTTKT